MGAQEECPPLPPRFARFIAEFREDIINRYSLGMIEADYYLDTEKIYGDEGALEDPPDVLYLYAILRSDNDDHRVRLEDAGGIHHVLGPDWCLYEEMREVLGISEDNEDGRKKLVERLKKAELVAEDFTP